MKFCKNLYQVVESSDPEWGPFWINYKYLKKQLNKIAKTRGSFNTNISGGRSESYDLNFDNKHHNELEFQNRDVSENVNNMTSNNDTSSSKLKISKVPEEIDFFKELKIELKESSTFFEALEKQCRTRQDRVIIGYNCLKNDGYKYDREAWARLLRSCINLYKDVLQLEKFAVTNYCGYSKILKKHDKLTGFSTRDAFMRNVMSIQNFTHYPYLLSMIKQSEELYVNILNMDCAMHLQQEEKLFIDAIKGFNEEAFKRTRRGSHSSNIITNNENIVISNSTDNNKKNDNENISDNNICSGSSSSNSSSASTAMWYSNQNQLYNREEEKKEFLHKTKIIDFESTANTITTTTAIMNRSNNNHLLKPVYTFNPSSNISSFTYQTYSDDDNSSRILSPVTAVDEDHTIQSAGNPHFTVPVESSIKFTGSVESSKVNVGVSSETHRIHSNSDTPDCVPKNVTTEDIELKPTVPVTSASTDTVINNTCCGTVTVVDGNTDDINTDTAATAIIVKNEICTGVCTVTIAMNDIEIETNNNNTTSTR